jgi:fumarate reductase subunit D
MKTSLFVPIMLLITGMLFLNGGMESDNLGVYIGCTLTGIVCMFCAVVYMKDEDDV